MQRVVGSLASFGARTFDGTKYVLPGSVLLEGDTTGAGAWATVPVGEYFVAWFAGYVVQRSYDDSAVAVDWSTAVYPGGLRITYTVNVSGTPTTYTNETITFAAEVDSEGNPVEFSPIGLDGSIVDLAVIDLVAQIVIAGGGNVTIDPNGIRLNIGTDVTNSISWLDGASVDSYIRGNVTGSLYVHAATIVVADAPLLTAASDFRVVGQTRLGVIVPAQITASQNNYEDGGGTIVRLTADAAYDITGWIGVANEIKIIKNASAFTLTFKNESASSTAGNRFTLGAGADVAVVAGGTIRLFYDNAASRWKDW